MQVLGWLIISAWVIGILIVIGTRIQSSPKKKKPKTINTTINLPKEIEITISFDSKDKDK